MICITCLPDECNGLAGGVRPCAIDHAPGSTNAHRVTVVESGSGFYVDIYSGSRNCECVVAIGTDVRVALEENLTDRCGRGRPAIEVRDVGMRASIVIVEDRTASICLSACLLVDGAWTTHKPRLTAPSTVCSDCARVVAKVCTSISQNECNASTTTTTSSIVWTGCGNCRGTRHGSRLHIDASACTRTEASAISTICSDCSLKHRRPGHGEVQRTTTIRCFVATTTTSKSCWICD